MASQAHMQNRKETNYVRDEDKLDSIPEVNLGGVGTLATLSFLLSSRDGGGHTNFKLGNL